jgi:hypothetical protein
MSFAAKILADSLSEIGHRLTTFEVTFPRIILAEFNTHRMFSRNSASSRAIPIKTMLKMVEEDPYVPTHWGKNQKGMAAAEELSPEAQVLALEQWLRARDNAVDVVRRLQMPDIDLHKQLANRLLEPFMWHTVIVSATEWENAFNLRDNAAAHPEIQKIVHWMKDLYRSNLPDHVPAGAWHLPLVWGQELHGGPKEGTWVVGDRVLETKEVDWPRLAKISVARCGRVSYLTHDGKRDQEEDLGLYQRLVTPGHMSPLEHAARPMYKHELHLFEREQCHWDEVHGTWVLTGKYDNFLGNFNGWVQHRKLIPGEADILGHRQRQDT